MAVKHFIDEEIYTPEPNLDKFSLAQLGDFISVKMKELEPLAPSNGERKITQREVREFQARMEELNNARTRFVAAKMNAQMAKEPDVSSVVEAPYSLVATPSISKVELSWLYNKQLLEDVQTFKIYRRESIQLMKCVAQVFGQSFVDATVAQGSSYTYCVSAVSELGVESPKSPVAVALIPVAEPGSGIIPVQQLAEVAHQILQSQPVVPWTKPEPKKAEPPPPKEPRKRKIVFED